MKYLVQECTLVEDSVRVSHKNRKVQSESFKKGRNKIKIKIDKVNMCGENFK